MQDDLTHPRNRLQKPVSHGPSLRDVALRAEVSTATVSRCLNSPEAVRPVLRRRVEAAVEELGYVRHGAARALRSQKSWTMGAVIPTIDNAIFASGVQALQGRLRLDGYTLLLASTEYDPRRELEEVEKLIARGVDGLVLIGEEHLPQLYELLQRKAIPYVNTWCFDAASPHPNVGFDNRAAAAQVTRYLLDMGHRDFAMIAGLTANNDRAAQRIEGVTAALRERGLRLEPGRLIERAYDIGEGRVALRELAALAPRPTAVVCGNDILALGALFECRASGIPVPLAMSICGFDDLTLAAHVDPPLTTARVPSQEMGCAAAEYLLARVDGQAGRPQIKLDVNLIVRASSGPPGGLYRRV